MIHTKLSEKEKQALENEAVVTDDDTLLDRTIDLKVEQKTAPVVGRMEKVLDRFEIALPLLEGCGKRQDNHTLWLVGLTAAVIFLGAIFFAAT